MYHDSAFLAATRRDLAYLLLFRRRRRSGSEATKLLKRWADTNGGITIVPEDDSIRIIDPIVPSNNYNGSLNEYLRTKSFTTAQPAPKLTLQSDGVYRYQPHNLIAMSERFDSAYWTKTDTTVTYGETAYDGTATATLCTQGTAGTAVFQPTSVSSLPSNGNLVLSYDLKRGNNDWFRIAFRDAAATNGATVFFNVATGAIGTTSSNGTGTYVSSTVTALANGWYRLSIVARLGGTDARPFLYACAADNDAARVNNATYYIARAQLNLGTVATSYVKTETHNLCLWSEDLTNSSWTKARCTISANASVGPNGLTIADRIVEDGTASNTHVVLSGTITKPSTAQNVVMTAHVRQGVGSRNLRFRCADSGATYNFEYIINPSTGAIVSGPTTGGGVTIVGAPEITLVASGLYRVSVVANFPAAASNVSVILGLADGTSTSYNGDSTSGIDVSCISIEFADVRGKYSATTSAAVYEPHVTLPYEWDASGNALGADLEEARTNSIRNNTGNTTGIGSVVLVGTTLADWGADAPVTNLSPKLAVQGSGASDGYRHDSIGATAGVANTVSVFLKYSSAPVWIRIVYSDNVAHTFHGFVNLTSSGATLGSFGGGGSGAALSLSLQNVGNGWFRVSLAGAVPNTVTGGAVAVNVVTGDNAGTRAAGQYGVACVQHEVGSFATSPIPTTTAAIARAADNASLATTLFRYSATAGTLYAEATNPNTAAIVGTHRALLTLSDLTVNERISMNIVGGAQTPRVVVVDGGATQANAIVTNTYTVNIPFKAAAQYAVDDFKACLDGGAVATDTAGTLPTVTQLVLTGDSSGTSASPNMRIRRLMYLPSRPDIQTLTAA